MRARSSSPTSPGALRRIDFSPRWAADLAAVHAADPRSPRILEDLDARTGPWLLRAVKAAMQHTQRDFAAYAGAGT